MTIYYFVFTIMLLLALAADDRHNISKQNRKVFLILIPIVMTLFQGLRWNTGGDWGQYLWTFENSKWDTIFRFERGYQGRYMEWGYMLINVTIKSIFQHYTFFLLITCGFINYTFYHFVDKYIGRNKGLALIIAICFSDMFPVRQFLAASVFYWAIPYILNRDWRRFLPIIFLCYTIHYSSVILLLFFWFNRHVKTWVLLGVYWTSSLWAIFLPEITSRLLGLSFLKGYAFTNLFTWYSSSIIEGASGDIESNQPIRAVLLASFLILLFCWMRNRIDSQKESQPVNLLLNIYVIGCIGKSLAGIAGLSELARLSYYSPLCISVLLIYSVNVVALYKKDYSLMLKIFVIILYFYHFSAFGKAMYSEYSVPYYSVFENSPVRDRWY